MAQQQPTENTVTHPIHPAHRREVFNAAHLYGLTGIVAILSDWARNEGGFTFVKNAIRDMDESFIKDFRFEREDAGGSR